MDEPEFQNLTPGEAADLALCGISAPAQLRRTGAEAVWRDLQKAQSFFPEHRITLTPARLLQLCAEAGAPQSEPLPAAKPLDVPAAEAARTLRPVPLRSAAAETAGTIDIPKAVRETGAHKGYHPIRCSHPLRTYLGAWATVLFFPGIFGIVSLPLILLFGMFGSVNPTYLIAGVLLLVAPYLIMLRRTTCSVCHVRVFSFSAYGRNRVAHHWPLLGYTLSTALHIIFCLSYNCPACGTPQKLFRRSHSHHHHS